MFERFTERARQVVVLAQEAAREFESAEIDASHFLLACYLEEEGIAAKALRYLNVSEGALRDQIPFGTAGKRTGKQIPFTPEAKGILELALREALNLGHNYISTEHIALGLIRDQPALVRRVVSPEALRQEIVSQVASPIGSSKAATEPDPVVVSFEIKPGQYWTDDDKITWKVVNASDNMIQLEHVKAQTLAPRDLVRTHRLVFR